MPGRYPEESQPKQPLQQKNLPGCCDNDPCSFYLAPSQNEKQVYLLVYLLPCSLSDGNKVWKAAFKKQCVYIYIYASVYFFKVMVNSDIFGSRNEQQGKWLKTRNRNTRRKMLGGHPSPPKRILPIQKSHDSHCRNLWTVSPFCQNTAERDRDLALSNRLLAKPSWHQGSIWSRTNTEHPTNNPTTGDWIINITLGKGISIKEPSSFPGIINTASDSQVWNSGCIYFFVPIYLRTSPSSFAPNLQNPASQSESFSSGTMLRLPLSSMTSSGPNGPSLLVTDPSIHQGTALRRRATAAMDRRSPVRRFSRRERRRWWTLGRSGRSWGHEKWKQLQFCQTTCW